MKNEGVKQITINYEEDGVALSSISTASVFWFFTIVLMVRLSSSILKTHFTTKYNIIRKSRNAATIFIIFTESKDHHINEFKLFSSGGTVGASVTIDGIHPLSLI